MLLPDREFDGAIFALAIPGPLSAYTCATPCPVLTYGRCYRPTRAVLTLRMAVPALILTHLCACSGLSTEAQYGGTGRSTDA
eukprot:3291743-Rhodomonas_salina.2